MTVRNGIFLKIIEISILKIFFGLIFQSMSTVHFPILPARSLVALGERIALARRARSLTQRDLAFLAGVGVSSVVALEKGHKGVALGTLARVLDAMELLGEMDHLVEPQRDQALTEFAISRLGDRK
jgi:DNA-binding XRE family transcriptional regulator